MNTAPELMADELGRSLVSVLGKPPDLGSLPRKKPLRRGLEE
jgi:hypothetical protein